MAATAAPARPARGGRVGASDTEQPLSRGPVAEILEGMAPAAALLRRTIGPVPRPALVTGADSALERFTDTAVVVCELASPPGRAGIGA